MKHLSGRILFWSPRALTILYAGFLGLFSLDVFDEATGFWPTALALSIHLIPSFVVLAALLLAWRWEWLGAVLYAFAAAAYARLAFPRHPDWFAAIGLPMLLVASLFLVNWLKRTEIRNA